MPKQKEFSEEEKKWGKPPKKKYRFSFDAPDERKVRHGNDLLLDSGFNNHLIHDAETTRNLSFLHYWKKHV